MKYIHIIFIQIALQTALFSQNSPSVTQFSGLVVGGDSLYGIPGVVVYVPKAGRGTVTNQSGYFSMPTLVGDTAIISALGYKKKQVVIPKSDKQSVTLIIELAEDTIYLPIVEIFPYPTEEVFKQAFIAMGNADPYYFRMANNVNPVTLQKLLRNSSLSTSENQRYTLRNQLYPGSGASYSQGLQLFNPYAWSDLVRSVRRNKKQRGNSNEE